MAEGALRASQGNSGEQSWPWGGGIERVEARASSSEGGGTLQTKARAWGWAKSTGCRASMANQRDRALASTNSLRQGRIKAARAREQVSHLGTTLGETWRGVWCSERPARRCFPPASSGGGRWTREMARVGELGQGRESGCGRAQKGAGGRGQRRFVERAELTGGPTT
jgi:hypothetical protein